MKSISRLDYWTITFGFPVHTRPFQTSDNDHFNHHFSPQFLKWNIRFWLKLQKNSGKNGLIWKMKFLWGPVSLIFCARCSVIVIKLIKFKKPSKTAVVHLGYSMPPAHHRTIWCRSTFGPRGPGLSNPTPFLRPALPMAPTTDNNASDERSVLRPTQRHS